MYLINNTFNNNFVIILSSISLDCCIPKTSYTLNKLQSNTANGLMKEYQLNTMGNTISPYDTL